VGRRAHAGISELGERVVKTNILLMTLTLFNASFAITPAPTSPPFLPQIRLYQNWLAQERGLCFETYDALWQWSVTDLEGFWQSIWDYFAIESPTPHSAALADDRMPQAKWFPGAQVNDCERERVGRSARTVLA
jgi:Acetyl-coenzyme A synthetase N-terminus